MEREIGRHPPRTVDTVDRPPDAPRAEGGRASVASVPARRRRVSPRLLLNCFFGLLAWAAISSLMHGWLWAGVFWFVVLAYAVRLSRLGD